MGVYLLFVPIIDHDQFGNKSASFDLFSLSNDPFKVRSNAVD